MRYNQHQIINRFRRSAGVIYERCTLQCSFMRTKSWISSSMIWRTSFWIFLVLVIYMSLLPEEFLPLIPFVGDKLSHSIAFAALALSIALAWPAKHYFLSVLMPLVVFGISIEVFQYSISGREFSLTDLLADVVGIIIVWTGIILLRSLQLNKGAI